jgi:hypothetical protein
MPLPQNAVIVPQPFDPSDLDKITVTISKAGVHTAQFPILEAGEDIAEYDLALTAEAIAIGLRIKDEPPYYTALSGQFLNFNLELDESMRGLATFNKGGVTVGIELTILTNAQAPRRKQRTIGIKVQQQ